MGRIGGHRLSSAVVVVVVGLVAGLGGVAFASIPSSGGVIHTCYSKRTGSLRVIDPSKHGKCKASEKQLTFNMQGPMGVLGAQGPQGLQGPAGPSTGPAGGDLTGSYPNPTIAAGKVTTPDFASGATAPNASAVGGVAPSSLWQVTGNSGVTNPILGTTDNNPLTLTVNGQKALLIQPDSTGGTTPNLVGGYSGNSVTAGVDGATIAGGGESGKPNQVTNDFGVVSGGINNHATGTFGAAIAGGNQNTASGSGAAVPGGFNNTSSGTNSLAGGSGNTSNNFESVAFGQGNTASGQQSTAFGLNNTASGDYAMAFGNGNTAENTYDTAFGESNTADGGASTTFGETNYTSNFDSTAFGYNNNRVGNTQSSNGQWSTAIGYENKTPGTTGFAEGGFNNASGTNSVAIGDTNTASAMDSIAVGKNVSIPTADNNTFAWSDGTQGSGSSDFAPTATDQFAVLATHGFDIQLSAPGVTFTGCTLTTSAGWACSSDRNVKRAFRPISDQAILGSLARMPIQSWSYKLDPAGTRHVGPTAQDFLAAFHIGSSPRLISMFDEGGVALAAIKGLVSLDRSQANQINGLDQQLNNQQAEINWLMAHAKTR